MKAMIGNICLVDGVETALDITHLMVLSGYSNPWCKIEPLPLTEEWLLRMGFEDVNFKGTYGFQFLDMYLSIYKSYGIWRIVFEKADRMLKIKHVHQLQNLYFDLTGEELKLIDG